jgi:hypothetical protein
MTTVTEAAKRLFSDDEKALRGGDLHRMREDPELAQRFARRLLDAAGEISPGRDWSVDDLREALELAQGGGPLSGALIQEGRYFRRRLREQCELAGRYGDPFACVVLTLDDGDMPPELRQTVLDAVTDGLRRSDLVFLYRRRFALILPRMRPPSLTEFLERIQSLVALGAGESAVLSIASMVFPNDRLPNARAVLDWAEDMLRDV